MSQPVALILAAVLCFALVPIAHHLVDLRIKVLRWLKWESFASWIERHRVGFTLAGRIVLTAVGLTLLIIGVGQL